MTHVCDAVQKLFPPPVHPARTTPPDFVLFWCGIQISCGSRRCPPLEMSRLEPNSKRTSECSKKPSECQRWWSATSSIRRQFWQFKKVSKLWARAFKRVASRCTTSEWRAMMIQYWWWYRRAGALWSLLAGIEDLGHPWSLPPWWYARDIAFHDASPHFYFRLWRYPCWIGLKSVAHFHSGGALSHWRWSLWVVHFEPKFHLPHGR